MKRSMIVLSVLMLMSFMTTSLGLTSIAVKSIKLNTESVKLHVGKTYRLKATFTPANSTNKNVTFSSANKSIATVSSTGYIKGIKAGKTVITVTSASNKKAVVKCNVTILQVALKDIKLLASEGKGALYEQNGNRILILKGTPYEMGYQHGKLLKENIKIVAKTVIDECEEKYPNYGMLEKIWDQQKELIPERFNQEMKGLADGSGLPLKDIQLANVMPELFHCSGIAVFGDATSDGRLYHARILDYFVDKGLQKQSVVIVALPEEKNAFINAGFAGFVGSVTGMNNKKISIGEMGGNGQGKWAGIPMTMLVRMVLEEAGSLEEAIDIFKNNPRTCEYYYVISDGNEVDAVALYTTPEILQTLKPGQNNPILSLPLQKDSLIITGSDRYPIIHQRIKDSYGNIDKDKMIEIIKRPVSLYENLHNAIFDTIDMRMWLAVAADYVQPDFQACYQNYYEYNLTELLKIANKQ